MCLGAQLPRAGVWGRSALDAEGLEAQLTKEQCIQGVHRARMCEFPEAAFLGYVRASRGERSLGSSSITVNRIRDILGVASAWI